MIGSKYCYVSKKRVLNGGFTTKYFNLETGARRGDLISAYLFILALEFFFYLSKMLPRKKVLKFSFIRHMSMIQRFASKI